MELALKIIGWWVLLSCTLGPCLTWLIFYGERQNHRVPMSNPSSRPAFYSVSGDAFYSVSRDHVQTERIFCASSRMSFRNLNARNGHFAKHYRTSG
jgi:hypothetical protein